MFRGIFTMIKTFLFGNRKERKLKKEIRRIKASRPIKNFTEYERTVKYPLDYDSTAYLKKLAKGDNDLFALLSNAHLANLTQFSLRGYSVLMEMSLNVTIAVWEKMKFKETIPCEPALTPRFAVSYMKPFIWSGDGSDKQFLPLAEGVELDDADDARISFDICRKDINIPAGKHLNAPMPIESIINIKDLYKDDDNLNLLSNVIVYTIERDIIEILENELVFEKDISEIDIELPLATMTLKHKTYLQAGTFHILGNEKTLKKIPKAIIDKHKYKTTEFSLINDELLVLFVPEKTHQRTFVYYPYNFVVEAGYIDPNRSKVPSIMITKREQYGAFVSGVIKLKLK